MKNSKLIKRGLTSLVVASLVFSNTFISKSTFANAETNKYTLSVGHMNPELAQYLKSGKKTGLVPLPVKLKNSTTKTTLKATTLPTTYDLRTLNRVTPIRDQGQIGSCWAFGTYASLESWMLTNGNGQKDYSENNLITHSGFDFGVDDGGNCYMSTAYLTRWDGPCNESDDPYANPADPSNVVVRNNVPVQQHVQDVLFIPDRTSATDNTDIKNAVMQYGALDTSMDYEDADFNSSTNAFYNSSTSSNANHAVAIVGWDDNYAASNFAKKPAGNGAFIIRNSWGSSWGIGGYFYVSYYDQYIGKNNAAFIDAQATNNYDKVYQYDPLGFTDQMGYNNTTAWFANVFKASGNDNLCATGFYTTQKAAQYQIYVETNYDTNKFTKLTLVKSGTIDMPGYHTIQLDTPVALTSGTNYAIAVKLVEAGETQPIAVEDIQSGYSSKATSSLGESFMSPDGQTWTDLMSSEASLQPNVCLKAFTKNGTAPVVTPTVTATTPANGATNVDNTKPITVTFNENVNAGTNFSGIKVADSTGKVVTTTNTITNNLLTLSGTLATGTNYTVTIPASAVVDASNNANTTAYTFSFTTLTPAPVVTPTVSSTNPVNGATGVDNTKPITVTFNENVKAGTNFSGIKVADSTGKVVTTTNTITNNILTLNGTLATGTTYTVTIPASAVVDASNNTNTSAYTFSFTTLTPAPVVTPAVTATTPANGATNVDNTKPITVTFNETVKAGTNLSGIKVVNSANQTVTSKSTINGNVLTITATMAASTKYTVTIPVNAVVDASNKTIASAYSFSFTTAAPAPTSSVKVTSTNPANGATNVSVYAILTANFNTTVKSGTNFSKIKVVDQYGYTVSCSCYASGTSLRIYPNYLDYGAKYTVTIPVGAITDLSGNTLVSAYTFSFTTQSNYYLHGRVHCSAI